MSGYFESSVARTLKRLGCLASSYVTYVNAVAVVSKPTYERSDWEMIPATSITDAAPTSSL